jgi:hypothetical protein
VKLEARGVSPEKDEGKRISNTAARSQHLVTKGLFSNMVITACFAPDRSLTTRI